MNPLDLNLQSPDYGLLAPQLIVFGLALLLMILDAFMPQSAAFHGVDGGVACRLRGCDGGALLAGW